MKQSSRILGLALSAAVTLVGLTHTVTACLNDPVPKDVSTVLENQGCGSFIWELQVQYGVVWDEGSASGSGTCAGGYYNCSCGKVGPYVKNSTKALQYGYIGPGEFQWWWNITNYDAPSDTYCTTGNGTCNGQAAVQKETIPSWIDYNQGWDDEVCMGQ